MSYSFYKEFAIIEPKQQTTEEQDVQVEEEQEVEAEKELTVSFILSKKCARFNLNIERNFIVK